MRIAVLDDEQIFCDKIRGVILHHKPGLEVDTFTKVKTLLNVKGQYDLLLLDIEMPCVNGIEFAKHYKGRFPYIVYVTSHDECVYDAFDTNILGFVVKRHLEPKLIKTIEQVMERQENVVTLATVHGNKEVAIDQILYFYIDDTGAIIAKTNQKSYHMNVKSLLSLTKCLDANKFCFASRRELVNVMNITHIYRAAHEILMSDDQRIHVSKRRWSNIVDKYNKEALL